MQALVAIETSTRLGVFDDPAGHARLAARVLDLATVIDPDGFGLARGQIRPYQAGQNGAPEDLGRDDSLHGRMR